MSRTTVNDILTVAIVTVILNLLFSFFLFAWVTDDDLTNIPKEPLNRFISLFYYSITTFTTTGFGDIYAKSNRMKLIISLYMISVFAITVHFLLNIKIMHIL